MSDSIWARFKGLASSFNANIMPPHYCAVCGREILGHADDHRSCDDRRERLVKILRQVIEENAPPLDPLSAEGDVDITVASWLQRSRREDGVLPRTWDNAFLDAWTAAVDERLEETLVPPGEADRLEALLKAAGISDEAHRFEGRLALLRHAAMIRHVVDGELPAFEGHVPFNLVADEQLVAVFENVAYYEDKIRRTGHRTWSSSYSGASVRLARGLYYRSGTSRGQSVSHTVESQEATFVDMGLLGLATEHLYFASDQRSFRIRYDKIVAVLPSDRFLTISRDAASAKPQRFQVGDGWLAYNLAVVLAWHQRMASADDDGETTIGPSLLSPSAMPQVTLQANNSAPIDGDKLLREAAEAVIQNQQGSTSLLQRRLRISYGRAVRIVDELQQAGVLGPPDGSKPRDVLVGFADLPHIFGTRP